MDEPSTTPTNSESRSSFPRNPTEFNSDPRISFSKLDKKYILETEDGDEYLYDEILKRWIPSLDDSLIEQQREAYKVHGVDENEVVVRPPRKKRKQSEQESGTGTGHKPRKPRTNSAVYITSIPLDATIDEIIDVFCKCGVIAEEIDSRRPRIKMYTDEQAIQMLDDSDFRFGEIGPQGKMKVQQADFSFKAQQEAPEKPNARDKARIMKKTQRLTSKLTDWDDDDDAAALQSSGRFEKVVILKHMFTLAELEDDPAAILDIKEDIREECSKIGDVTNVVLYDNEKSGVVTVRFKSPESAQACVRMMHGRFFGGTQVEAYMANGAEKFKKSSNRNHDYEDDGSGWEVDNGTSEDAKRLEKFGSWIESRRLEAKIS